MKSKITENQLPADKTYPYLGIYEKDKNFIVLFTSSKNGVIVWTSGRSQYNVGYTGCEWQESQFTPFSGTVQLSN